MMREAQFRRQCSVGIETPEPEALKAMRKEQNASLPILEAISTLNRYGIEVVSGHHPRPRYRHGRDRSADLKAFIDASQIPMLTINLLQALPKTPLWDRLSATSG